MADITPEEVEPESTPEENGELAVNPVAVLRILQQKAQRDPLLSAQLEAATYRAALETLRT